MRHHWSLLNVIDENVQNKVRMHVMFRFVVNAQICFLKFIVLNGTANVTLLHKMG